MKRGKKKNRREEKNIAKRIKNIKMLTTHKSDVHISNKYQSVS